MLLRVRLYLRDHSVQDEDVSVLSESYQSLECRRHDMSWERYAAVWEQDPQCLASCWYYSAKLCDVLGREDVTATATADFIATPTTTASTTTTTTTTGTKLKTTFTSSVHFLEETSFQARLLERPRYKKGLLSGLLKPVAGSLFRVADLIILICYITLITCDHFPLLV